MPNRQKIYIGLAVSAGVCTGVALLLYLRHRRQLALSKTPKPDNDRTKPSSIFSRHVRQYTDITSSSTELENGGSESVRFQSGGATIEVDIPGGGTPLTADQAIVLTRFLQENDNDINRLHRILTNIANAATFKEGQINLADAGCINSLREILQTVDNETTQCKILLALNNLALNDYTITHFSGIIPIVINLCRTTPSNSLVRLYGLNLLINMSVLENLHNEFMQDILDLGLLIESTFNNDDAMLSAGKVLVNLSTNKLNLEHLLKLTGVELKTIVNICTPKKKSNDTEKTSKLEEILLRYLTFYCNLGDLIVKEIQQEKDLLNDPIPYRQGAVYFELFDHEKQMVTKSLLRPQYSLHMINSKIKSLRHSMDTIRQIQLESSVSSIQNEFNDYDPTDSSTPKKTTTTTATTLINGDHNLEQQVNGEFDDDDDDTTILPGSSTPSDQSLASFRSALSTNENNTFTSPDNSLTN